MTEERVTNVTQELCSLPCLPPTLAFVVPPPHHHHSEREYPMVIELYELARKFQCDASFLFALLQKYGIPMKLQDHNIFTDEGIATAYLRKYGPLPSQAAAPFPAMPLLAPARIAHARSTVENTAMGDGDKESVDSGENGIDHFGSHADAAPRVENRRRRTKRLR